KAGKLKGRIGLITAFNALTYFDLPNWLESLQAINGLLLPGGNAVIDVFTRHTYGEKIINLPKGISFDQCQATIKDLYPNAMTKFTSDGFHHGGGVYTVEHLSMWLTKPL
ncbi:MAG: hypothetical protein ACHQVK_03940, partial [Candidatus Paceibacterales bacterium]